MNIENEHWRELEDEKRDKNVGYMLVCTYNVIKNIYYLNFIAEFLILKQ